jgi:hypothetical protein
LRARLAASLVTLSVSLGAFCPGCGTPNPCTIVLGPVNDPANRTMRRKILSYGLDQFCTKMVTRNAPLKLSADSPVIGRFYPKQCNQKELDNGDLWVEFAGAGYAYTNVSKKITFTAGATLTYDQDFRCSDKNDVYAYFPTRNVQPADFHMTQIEQPMANLVQNWIGPYADSFGKQMLSGQLAQGFTVVHDTDGNDTFDMGILPLGQRPFQPFNVHGSDRILYENNRTEVHTGERDFIGPIDVEDDNRALYITMTVDGAPNVDLLVMPRNEAEASLQLYLDYPQVGPLAFPPRMQETVQAGAEFKRTVPVARGMHYVVLDNTAFAGPSAPVVNPLVDTSAVVNYLIQIGDAS